MRHPGGERADGLQLLRLDELRLHLCPLFFRLLAISDIAADAEHADEFSVRAPIVRLEGVQQCFPAIGIGDPFLIVPGLALRQHLKVIFPERIGNLLVKEIVVGIPDNLVLWPPHELDEGGIAAQVNPLGILEKNDVRI